MKLSRQVPLYAVLTTVIITVVMAALVVAEKSSREASDALQRHYLVQILAAELQQLLTDRETGQRGYLLTLDPVFLEPYQTAGQQLETRLGQLQPLMTSSAWKALRQKVDARRLYFQETLALSRQSTAAEGQQLAIELVRSGAGKGYMDDIRALLTATIEREQIASQAAAEALRTVETYINGIFAVSAVCFAYLLVMPTLFLRRRVLKPLEQLSEKLERISEPDNEGSYVPLNSVDEIEVLNRDLMRATGVLRSNERLLTSTLAQQKHTNARLEKVFAIVGHELRTPAAALSMLIDELKTDPKSESRLSDLQNHAQHLLGVMDDMRLVTGKGALTETNHSTDHVDVTAILRSCTFALQPLADTQETMIDLNLDSQCAGRHAGHARPIQQIVQNLIKNAILHSGGNHINVSASARPQGDTMTGFEIEVRDNGCGIDPAFQDSMYNAFERGVTSAAGSGLGLNIALQLASELPGGQLSYRDNPEGGSIFELSFTLRRADRSTLPNQASHILNGLRILLVEDTATLRLLVKNSLQREGVTVCTAADGEDALRQYEQFDPDLVLTDIMMPKMDGYALTHALRKRDFKRPIVGLTSAVIGAEASHMIDAGANKVLAKPLNVSDLGECVAELSESMSSASNLSAS